MDSGGGFFIEVNSCGCKEIHFIASSVGYADSFPVGDAFALPDREGATRRRQERLFLDTLSILKISCPLKNDFRAVSASALDKMIKHYIIQLCSDMNLRGSTRTVHDHASKRKQ